MTAPTSQKLADVLRAAGLDALAIRAEADEFHDFLSPHTFPEMELAKLLAQASTNNLAAANIRDRLIAGEFDASEAESNEWAQSPEGQEVIGQLVKTPKPNQ